MVMYFEEAECPFCHAIDFDLIGLKRHILHYCNEFNDLEEITPNLVFGEDSIKVKE